MFKPIASNLVPFGALTRRDRAFKAACHVQSACRVGPHLPGSAGHDGWYRTALRVRNAWKKSIGRGGCRVSFQQSPGGDPKLLSKACTQRPWGNPRPLSEPSEGSPGCLQGGGPRRTFLRGPLSDTDTCSARERRTPSLHSTLGAASLTRPGLGRTPLARPSSPSVKDRTRPF